MLRWNVSNVFNPYFIFGLYRKHLKEDVVFFTIGCFICLISIISARSLCDQTILTQSLHTLFAFTWVPCCSKTFWIRPWTAACFVFVKNIFNHFRQSFILAHLYRILHHLSIGDRARACNYSTGIPSPRFWWMTASIFRRLSGVRVTQKLKSHGIPIHIYIRAKKNVQLIF